MKFAPSVIFIVQQLISVSSFCTPSWSRCHVNRNGPFVRFAASDSNTAIDVEGEVEEPGTMRVSEIKAELNLRGIDYTDCFDKESLAQRLREARAKGKADPSILEKFNKSKEETLNIDDETLEKAIGGDGTLPGGMPPDMLKKLMGNPELMELMSNPKMQEVMTMMMTGGQDTLMKAMAEDQEVYEIVTKLNQIMGKAL